MLFIKKKEKVISLTQQVQDPWHGIVTYQGQKLSKVYEITMK